MDNTWSVYIIECRDGKLYTGITKNLNSRIKQHNRGKGCRFTAFRAPVKLLYDKKCYSRSQALKYESSIKGLTRTRKLELIKGTSVV